MSWEGFSTLDSVMRTTLDCAYQTISKATFSTSKNARAKRATRR